MHNIKGIVKKVLEEQIKNKQLFDRLYTKWKESLPNLTPEDAERIYLFHDRRKSNIKRGHPAVEAFLDRFDGNHGAKKYELKNLLDVQQINIIDLIEFLIDFGDFNYSLPNRKVNSEQNEKELKKIFSENGNDFTPEKIEASKKMWFSNDAIINNGGVRVYAIRNEDQAVRMGYWYQTIHREQAIKLRFNKDLIQSPWCVTHRNGVQIYGNESIYDRSGPPRYTFGGSLYGNYRQFQKYTFYFVIDENKDPLDSEYYMSALIRKENGSFVLVTLRNKTLGEGVNNSINWNFISNIYPQLKDFKDRIVYRELDENEYEKISIINRINETDGHPNNYQRQPPDVKEAYITAGGILKRPRSWEVTSARLRRNYIDTITELEHVTLKFSDLEFLSVVLNTPGMTELLERRLKFVQFKGGIVAIAERLLRENYSLFHTNIKNKNMVLFQHKMSQKFGIYMVTNVDWLKIDGVTYLPQYKFETDVYVDDKGNTFLVKIFTINGNVDEKTFYCLTDTDEKNNQLEGYFFTHKRWMELLEKEGLTNMIEKPDLDPDVEADVAETTTSF